MGNIASLYAALGVSQTCSDEELKKAWRQQLLTYHPDHNPEDVAAATARTQQLNTAYEALKEQRRQQESTADNSSSHSSHQRAWMEMDEFKESATLTEIVARKASFRTTWNAFRASPRDVMRALAFIHATVEMERIDAVIDLLGNSILIDAAPLLIEMIDPSSATQTLLKWCDQLAVAQRYAEALGILEDCLAIPMPSYTLLKLKDKLRSRYYRFAQGYYAPDKQKPAPDIRISYLMRILDLGFHLGYVHKYLAEAYLEKGDLDTARQHVECGLSLDPRLSVAKLAKTLGVNRQPIPRSIRRKDPRLPDDVDLIGGVSRKAAPATLLEVRNWMAAGSWTSMLTLATRPDYNSLDREVMCLVARALARCPDTQAAEQSLLTLARSVYSDVRHAAHMALASIGSAAALDAFRQAPLINPNNPSTRDYIDYLECRVDPKRIGADYIGKADALAQGRQALNLRRFGLARFWLEQALHTAPGSEKSGHPVVPISDNFETVFMLAQACAGMRDTDQALLLMMPLLEGNSQKANANVQRALADWLWSELAMARCYDPANDDRYILALRIHADVVLQTKKPDDLLHWIRYLTRWFEHFGAEELILWIRHQVRDAAPGYGELERGMIYAHWMQDQQPSERITAMLSALESQIRSGLSQHLHEVFGTTLTVNGKTHLLDA